jgi:carbamoyl-phosphate synthase large subunit
VSFNVLITAASRRVPLVHAFRRALARSGGGRVIVTDVNALSPAVHVADQAFRVPLATDRGYVPAILALCETAGVGLVVPTIDDELFAFAEAAATFAAAGVRVAVSPPDTTAVCNDKYQTCRFLRSRGIAAAASYLPAEVPAEASYPLFIKPRAGRGSVGAHLVRDARELAFFRDYVPDPVVQEYLDGPEFTIDLLCSFSGQPLAIVPRERLVVRAGVTDRGRTVKEGSLMRLAEDCAAVLPFAGPVNVQCRVVGGRPVVFEINPRFSGGIPLTIEAGADFAAMLLDLGRGRAVAPRLGEFRDGLVMTNCDAQLFLTQAEADARLAPLGSSEELV